MNGSFDVIVIGGGMAGAAAALSATAAGAHTALVSARPGATALCGGAWRGALPAPLAQQLGEVGYHVVATRQALPWADGSIRSFDECHSMHAAEEGGRTLVVGIAGLPAFHAVALAECWRESFVGDLSPVTVTLPGTPVAGWAPASLARFVEANTNVFCDAIAPHVGRLKAEVLLLPPILGVDAAEVTRNAIEARLGVRAVEIGGGTPSLPGWRLVQALENCLTHAGVVRLGGTATGCTKRGKQVTALAVAGAPATEISAHAFVLATGKFLGGGIVANETFREPVFGLPVWLDHLGERFERVEPLALTNAERTARQALLCAGVAADDSGRPLDPHGTIVLENVYVAGVVRSDADGSAMNLGHVALDGWGAGARAAA